MAIEEFMDWKGKPINKEKHGGVRAAYFIYCKYDHHSYASHLSFIPCRILVKFCSLFEMHVMSKVSYDDENLEFRCASLMNLLIAVMVTMLNIAFVSNSLNLVTYLHGTMHMGIARSTTMVTNFIGASCAFALLGAFLSDSYITRFTTILVFGPFELLGYGLLALQAHFPTLHPSACDTAGNWTSCEQVHGFNSILINIAIYTVALGEGCLRATVPSLGGDQFDSDHPVESKLQSSFFNWYTFGISFGAVIGLLLIVWVENSKGWYYGFGLSAFVVLLGVLVVASGFSFFRNQKPKGSPLTRILQVVVAAFKNRKLSLTEDGVLPQARTKEDLVNMEVLSQTKDFKFLDKASIFCGDDGAWSYCSVSQVEETKIILRILPIYVSSLISYIPIPLLLTLTVQQGGTVDTKLGKIHIPPASLLIIPATFQMVILVFYDSLFVPFARRITGYASGITQLQRIGVGFVSISVAMLVAALIERKRKSIAFENGLQDSDAGIPMSILWLGIQFFLLGISDVTSFTGLLEFFNGEASRGMKSMGTAIFWCILGMASFLGTFLVNVVNKFTRHGDKGLGWIEGSNLNETHLDRFYWLLCVLGFLAFLNYLYWASRYVYRHNPRITTTNL